jgi:hypothetical protein
MNKEIRNQRLGEAVARHIENGNIEEMFYIFDDDGFVVLTRKSILKTVTTNISGANSERLVVTSDDTSFGGALNCKLQIQR